MTLRIVNCTETLFFSHFQGKLCQWIELTVDSDSSLAAVVEISAGEETVATQLELRPGEHIYRVYAPTLWPNHPPEAHAPLRVTAEGQSADAAVSVGNHRPWVIYLLADVCTDATWVYGDFDAMRKDDADLTAAELALCEATRGSQWAGEERRSSAANHNHYNLVHALNLEYFEEFYPGQVARLEEALRRGEICLNPFYNMTMTQNISLEEQIRLFYPARKWALRTGAPMYANHQETPSIAWDMPGILAGIGVRHLAKAILPYECPWAERLEVPPLFLWEGVDGTRILVRWRNTDYVEGNFVLKGLTETLRALHENILLSYEKLGARYPFNAIALLGCYGDLIPYEPGKPQSRDLPLLKAATIAAYNAQGWEFPRLVNASHGQFWEDIEGQIAERAVQLEVHRGDFGTGWDTWPACLAFDVAGYRRAQERAGAADKLAAVLSRLAPEEYARCAELLEKGWRNLRYLADHAWNGANDANRALNSALRRQWQVTANQAFDRVIAEGLQQLAVRVPAGEGLRFLVFNSLGWERSGVVQVEAPQAASSASLVVDVASGQPVATQVAEENGQPVLYFQADGVPSVGYRLYDLAAQASETPARSIGSDLWKITGNSLEGPFYIVEVSPVTGGITRLYDKVRGKELVDTASPYHLNQCLYFSDGALDPKRPFYLFQPPAVSGQGVEYTPRSADVEIGPGGPVFCRVVVRAAMKHIHLTSTITLYAHLDRVDIRNEVVKVPTTEKQQLDFAFPFHVPERQYRFETPAAVITAGKDQLPGAGQSAATVRHFVDVSNREYGVTLSLADSFVVQFGHRTTGEDPLGPDANNSTVMAMAMGNIYDSNEAIRDQAGVTRFIFRFSLQGHSGDFDAVRAVRFGWEDNNELLAAVVPASQRSGATGRPSELPSTISFVQVTPANAILTTLKPGEEGGLVMRLWECTGREARAEVRLAGLGRLLAAHQTDHLERDQGALPLQEDAAQVLVGGRSVRTIQIF